MAETQDEVLHSIVANVATVVLNRPKALNSLNLNMVETLMQLLHSWTAPGSNVSCLIIKGAGGKAFCAGGDVRAATLAAQAKQPTGEPMNFFNVEYAVDLLISRLPFPYVALVDGIVMGGGAGLSMNGSFRVATERSLFAMPECAIGFFPDVGASHFLQRLLPGYLGLFLALTGTRLRGMELKEAGLATHLVPSGSLPQLEARLHELGPSTRDFTIVSSVLSEFEEEDQGNANILATSVAAAAGSFMAESPSPSVTIASGGLGTLHDRIPHVNRHFSHRSVPEIMRSLEAARDDTGLAGAFARDALQGFARGSPLSLLITFEMMRRARHKTLAHCLDMDSQLVAAFCRDQGDWFEGVRVTLVNKGDKPRWKYPSVEVRQRPDVDFAALVEAMTQMRQGDDGITHRRLLQPL